MPKLEWYGLLVSLFFFFFLIYVSQNHAIPVEGKKTKSLVYFFFLL